MTTLCQTNRNYLILFDNVSNFLIPLAKISSVVERLLLESPLKGTMKYIFLLPLRGSESQLKIQISRHNIADEKISNLPITNNKNNITEYQDCIALRYTIIYHFTKFEVSI